MKIFKVTQRVCYTSCGYDDHLDVLMGLFFDENVAIAAKEYADKNFKVIFDVQDDNDLTQEVSADPCEIEEVTIFSNMEEFRSSI